MWCSTVFLFSIRGREVVTVRAGTLVLRLETFLGLGWGRRMGLAEVEAPRLLALRAAGNKKLEEARAAGAVLPDYAAIRIKAGKKRWMLGVGLSQGAAKDLLHTLSARFGLPRAADGVETVEAENTSA